MPEQLNEAVRSHIVVTDLFEKGSCDFYLFFIKLNMQSYSIIYVS